eukprot:CAMPEP_0170625858 /NCGR_PEP_ID=MMETSP0224-20130122/31013_1 /TAXON_ID=285029 /ORGANISM="Togula jolla, Strain CCCM 725" /LENGTH=129 /DNA_ID=CAMNT_0010952521 /DNA_START=187 /DNA_END=574 /DNA_ORIENTATION=+
MNTAQDPAEEGLRTEALVLGLTHVPQAGHPFATAELVVQGPVHWHAVDVICIALILQAVEQAVSPSGVRMMRIKAAGPGTQETERECLSRYVSLDSDFKLPLMLLLPTVYRGGEANTGWASQPAGQSLP